MLCLFKDSSHIQEYIPACQEALCCQKLPARKNIQFKYFYTLYWMLNREQEMENHVTTRNDSEQTILFQATIIAIQQALIWPIYYELTIFISHHRFQSLMTMLNIWTQIDKDSHGLVLLSQNRQGNTHCSCWKCNSGIILWHLLLTDGLTISKLEERNT